MKIAITIPDEITDKGERLRFYMREYGKQYEKTYRDHRTSYRNINREKVRAGIRDHYYRNKERLDAKNKAWASKNRERAREITKAWRLRNPEKSKESQNRYWTKNREKLRQKWNRKGLKRRARIFGSVVDLAQINEFISMVRAREEIKCYYCNVSVSGKYAHIDHVVPLSKGGGHVIGNLCAACPRCNLSKHDRLISEWWDKPGQQILNM